MKKLQQAIHNIIASRKPKGSDLAPRGIIRSIVPDGYAEQHPDNLLNQVDELGIIRHQEKYTTYTPSLKPYVV